MTAPGGRERPMRFVSEPAGEGGQTRPASWLGANFWSRSGGPRMWTRYDPRLVREELQVLADHGLTMTRSFFYWPDFEPEPDRLDEECLAHFADFLDAHREIGLHTVPTFLVGHMSGQNWDPAWRGGRDLYRDVWFVARQAWYVRELAARFHEHPAVAGWLLSNEMPIYGGPAPRPVVAAWAQLLVDAVRASGATQPVSVGDGAWGVESTGHDNGFSLTDLASLTQFVGPHVYRMETDQTRQHLKAAYVAELCQVTDLPVVLEEFGVTTDFVSAEGAASYYRQQLYNTLTAGVTGWIAWNNTDYDDLVAQRPYSHHPFEMHFGITDSRGRPKTPLLEMQKFAASLAAIDVRGARRSPAQAALVVPSHLGAAHPFANEADSRLAVAAGEQAYVAAKEAHLPVGVVREAADGGLPAGYRLYLAPSVKQLCGPTWRQFFDLAESGSVVYASYCVGEAEEQRGPWWAYTDELFGVRRRSAYGLVEPITEDTVTLTMTADFGSLRAGERLQMPVAASPGARAFLPVTATTGEVLAVDAHGRPALIRQRHGAGSAVLCVYPLEYSAARRPDANPEDTWRLYAALAASAGIEPAVAFGDPRVFVDVLESGGRRFAVFVSQHREAVTVEARPAHGMLRGLDGSPAPGVSLEPYGAAVLMID